ncbi:MAG: ribonuclease D [Pseudomonadota bacterium]
MSTFTLVPQASDALPSLNGSNAVGIDTEFMRERTFFAELCLLQLAAGETLLCVDPLLNDNQEPLWQRLAELEWIVHSARQDLEVIYQTAGILPRALFDTQVAAGLAGHQPQIGYAGLVKLLFDVELPKTHTRANWAKRPLQDHLLEYAAEDVEYLLPARERLAETLDRTGRLEWAIEDSALLLDKTLYTATPETAVDRLKGARSFRGRRRNAAALLASWREQRAIDRNKPRQWILKDSVLLDIAYKLPDTVQQLKTIADLPPGVLKRSADELLSLVSRSERDDGGYQPPGMPDEAQKALLKSMQSRVAAVARELGLANEVVASKKELSAAVLANEFNSRVFRSWRKPLIGDELLALL